MPTADLSFVHRLLERSTVRAFDDRPVPPDLLDLLLRAALHAPSELNLQPWRPIACTTAASRARLRACCLDQPQVESAPVAVVVVVDTRVFLEDLPRAAADMVAIGRWSDEEREIHVAAVRAWYADPPRLRDSAMRNGAIFGHQLLLAAFSAGLSAFWLAGMDEAALRSAFAIPDSGVVVGVVGLGWPAPGALAPPAGRVPRHPPERVLHWEAW